MVSLRRKESWFYQRKFDPNSCPSFIGPTWAWQKWKTGHEGSCFGREWIRISKIYPLPAMNVIFSPRSTAYRAFRMEDGYRPIRQNSYWFCRNWITTFPYNCRCIFPFFICRMNVQYNNRPNNRKTQVHLLHLPNSKYLSIRQWASTCQQRNGRIL